METAEILKRILSLRNEYTDHGDPLSHTEALILYDVAVALGVPKNEAAALDPDELLSYEEVAERKGVEVHTVRRAVYRGDMNKTVLNPDDPPNRHIVRVVVDDKYHQYQPRQMPPRKK